MQEKQVLLKFGGIDTFATVTLNRQKVMEANNFHRHWTVAVKDLLVPGTNQLGIAIRPAMQESLQLKEQYPYTVPALHQMGSIGAYNFIRKPVTGGKMCKLSNRLKALAVSMHLISRPVHTSMESHKATIG
eukprot:GHUV01010525.1.p2 GENE.GHUV01010525.1~~GHUV01010525.1.p2  ORF type:complete len:131 (+),score=27.56 GHUV01010525.1:1286-1678(+)